MTALAVALLVIAVLGIPGAFVFGRAVGREEMR